MCARPPLRAGPSPRIETDMQKILSKLADVIGLVCALANMKRWVVGENEGRLLEYLWMEMSLVYLADRIPQCRALLVQLGRPLVALRHTLAFTVERPKICHRTLRLEL